MVPSFVVEYFLYPCYATHQHQQVSRTKCMSRSTWLIKSDRSTSRLCSSTIEPRPGRLRLRSRIRSRSFQPRNISTASRPRPTTFQHSQRLVPASPGLEHHRVADPNDILACHQRCPRATSVLPRLVRNGGFSVLGRELFSRLEVHFGRSELLGLVSFRG